MSSAEDGAGDHAQRLAPARPGPDPTDHPWPDESSGDGLALDVVAGRYAVSGTWYTDLDDDGCFARWRFLPTPSS